MSGRAKDEITVGLPPHASDGSLPRLTGQTMQLMLTVRQATISLARPGSLGNRRGTIERLIVASAAASSVTRLPSKSVQVA
jgi:hypothetical protein